MLNNSATKGAITIKQTPFFIKFFQLSYSKISLHRHFNDFIWVATVIEISKTSTLCQEVDDNTIKCLEEDIRNSHSSTLSNG